MIYLGIDHVIRNLTSFRLAAYDMKPCCDFNGSPAGLRPSWIRLGLFDVNSLDGAEKRCIWILGGANTTFLNDDGAASGLQKE